MRLSGAKPNRGAVEPPSVSARSLVTASAILSVALVALYLAAGGRGYEPTPVADPCAPREWSSPEGAEETAQQFFLSALDGAACELGVSREALAAGLATEESRVQFAAEQGIDAGEIEIAIRAGVVRAIDDAEDAAAIDPLVADGLRAFVVQLPLDELIVLIYNATAAIDAADGVVGDLLP